MYIVIKDGTSIKSFALDKVDIPYVYKGIEINLVNNLYYISLKNGYFFEDRDKVRRLEYRKYIIKNKDIFNDIELYVYKNDKGIEDYKMYENKPFVFLASKKANIINKDKYLKNIYLIYKDKKLKTNSDFLYLNNKKYNDEELKNNDEVCLYNFRFIYHDDYLYINNFLIENKLQIKELKENIVKYQDYTKPINNYYLEPIHELVIDPLTPYEEVKIFNQKKLIYQIGPSLTMAFATLTIASINIYNNYLNGGPLLNSIVYIIMPLTMIFSGVMWPVISRSAEKKEENKIISENKNIYLDYLLKYKDELTSKIDKYLKDKKEYFFDGRINKDRLFYITNKSKEFLNISLGEITLNKSLDTKSVKDVDINEKINALKYQLKNIENCPYFINILDFKAISIIANKSLRNYLIRKYLLEVSSKYHYDDFYMAIYSENLNAYSDFFSLPQLICNNNRLTLNKVSDLQELNNTNLTKPLVLYSDKRINIDFTNNQIHIISFLTSSNDLYKNSDLLIEYKDDCGYVYGKEKICFKYKQDEINFKNSNDLLGNYQRLNYLKRTITFKDVFKEINVGDFYKAKQKGLQADFAILNKELLSFDLHESKCGPHGLIGGATGSGKSELIVSMLLSLCLRYRPDYLNIILIDYKGGGIKESLSYNGTCLPHIIASIDNLDSDVFERLIVAIDRECKKRQKLFKELSRISKTSIMNIDDYLENVASYNMPKIAHLLIVVDEFAELKKENPTIIKELISFSRIGRSLGLHLILATQRPSGIIDDEIWSNSRFKIALKVFNEKDSNDIIKIKDAAYLNNPGEFILNIDGNTSKASSIYAKKDINNGDPYEVCLLNNKLDVISKKTIKHDSTILESSYIVNKILETSKLMKIEKNILDFNKPKEKTIKELINIYKPKENSLIIGEIDDYLNAYKDILKVASNENILIYSSRDKEINNILNSLKRKIVVIGQDRYTNPYICDSIKYDELSDLNYLFNKLINGKEELSLVIEDISCLLTYSEEITNKLYNLIRRSEINNINIIAITKQSSLNFKLVNSFKNKFAIKILDRQDLINLFSTNTSYVGDSYSYLNGSLISFIPSKIEEFNQASTKFKSLLDKIPEDIKMIKNNNGLLMGYDINTREAIYLKDNEDILISSYDEDLISKYKKILKDYKNVNVEVYNNNLNKETYRKYLWLGDGIFAQRLFYVDIKNDLENSFAYLYMGNKGKILRVAK